MCIDNTHEIAQTIQTTLEVNDVMKQIKATMQVEQANDDQLPSD